MDIVENGATRRRAAQAASTRAEIVMAAGRLMLERGYVGTSVAAIAAEAGVVVQTIYNSVGSKAELLAAVLDRVAAEPGAPALLSGATRERIAEARTATEVIRILARSSALVNERTSGILRIVSEAAVVDPDVGEFEQKRDAARLHGFGEVAAALREKRGLRGGISDHEAAATMWALAHPHTFRTLVLSLGWSTEAYLNWLEKSLLAALL
ncbi:TetR/AcrR family transcriptional regulator [Cryobacterium sp. TMT1-3]|uniref:TetR/AcrR family transcriptional regulator n=1 Tax=Cryobacterium luteum TaxID=1424661 RepID=A0A1H8D5D0_9MICO|nr:MULTISPECIES: TetR/AcrR family transcriptional regulator [Cryobacterium]TFB91888.1 TetR/AcrR family transcriptional regulator [Cryobacterium luteum]TFC31138.1 TetR/AcrR family transcriptional regulator [Cryobacterium sp. TMT1-3]SEN01984.1 transcriptional regulator, TetR family [Cryobacterium luteum]